MNTLKIKRSFELQGNFHWVFFSDPELEEFFNNLCRERFGQDFVPGTNQQSSGHQSGSADARKRRGKKKK